jgi:hypothetical protein
LSQKSARRGCGREEAAEVRFEAFVLLIDAAGAVALFVTSDTTTTVVDVLCAVSLDSEGRVRKVVLESMVEIFVVVIVLNGTMNVVVVEE